MSITGLPTPGTPASAKSRSDLRGTAQREAVALVDAWQNGKLIPDEELALLRRIAAHRLASRMMATLGHDVERLTAIVLRMPGLFENDVDTDDGEEDEDADPDGPPHGQDWCRRGCQILYSMECGMCGYEGRGVWADQVDTVAEHCCHCNARTYQSRDGICELCGKDAEDDSDTPAAAGPAPCARPDPDRNAQPSAADTRDTPNGSGPATCERATAGGER